MSGEGYKNTAIEFTNYQSDSSGQPGDIAIVFDSEGDDTFESYPDRAVMTGGGVVISTHGFEATYGVSQSGTDTALMHDSQGDDRFISKNDRAIISGAGYRSTAIDFTNYQSDSSGQPGDIAIVYDSEVDDTFESYPDRAVMTGGGVVISTHGFEATY